MKTLIKRISKLSESIELGLITRSESMYQLRVLRSDISNKYNEGSDNYMTLIYDLIDVNTLIQETYTN
jgi:hypothetical protein